MKRYFPKAPITYQFHNNETAVVRCGVYKARIVLKREKGYFHASIHEKDETDKTEMYITKISSKDLGELICELIEELTKYQETAEEIEEKYGDNKKRNRRPPL